jgi:hypothetical protein
MVNPEGTNHSIVEDGSYRALNGGDYGQIYQGKTDLAGPPGLAELRQGKTSAMRIGTPRKPSGGANANPSGPTEAQRNSIDAEGFRRAGPPTPPKQ